MKKRHANAADQALAALFRLTSASAWRERSTVQKQRQAIVEFAMTIAAVNGALAAALPDDPEAEA